jgi:hypothetical protein
MKTAIKSNYFTPLRELRTLKSDLQAQKSGVSPEDQYLSDMRATKGWEILNEFIDNIKIDLDQMIKNLLEDGASYEVIGQKTIVKELTTEVLDRIQNKVNDANDAIENEK